MIKSAFAYASTVMIFVALFLVSFATLNELCIYAGLAPGQFPDLYLPLFCIVTLLLPVVIGFAVSRTYLRWYERRNDKKTTWIPSNKAFIVTLVCLYLLTAFSGVPAVQSHNSDWALTEFKKIRGVNNPVVMGPYPTMATYFSLPILPFVVLSYHEYILAGLYGWGGWDIQVWHVSGVKRVVNFTVWIS